jgi:hypothetical protein
LLIDEGVEVAYVSTVTEELVAEAKAARKEAKQVIEDEGATSADIMSKVLQRKSTKLLLKDPQFKLELGLVTQLVAEGSNSQLLRRALAVLPSANKMVTVDRCAQQLHQLGSSDLHKVSSRGSQEKLKVVQQMVNAIVQGLPPDISLKADCEFVSNAVTSFQWFVTLPPSTGSANARIKYGDEAMKGLIAKVKQKHTEGTATLDDIRPLKVFFWLVPAEHADAINKITVEVSSSTAAALEVAQAPKAKAKSKAGKASKVDDAMKSALDMFR